VFDNVLQAHFYREFEDPKDRRSRQHEVDFVAERLDGSVLPLEVKFRKRIDSADVDGLRYFGRKFGSPLGVVVTRDVSRWDARERIHYVPLQSFLLAF
jgi:predicted AAA+ superfamily ATPase